MRFFCHDHSRRRQPKKIEDSRRQSKTAEVSKRQPKTVENTHSSEAFRKRFQN